MARSHPASYAKRAREAAKRAKRQEKAEKKAQRRAAAAGEELLGPDGEPLPGGEASDPEAPPDGEATPPTEDGVAD